MFWCQVDSFAPDSSLLCLGAAPGQPLSRSVWGGVPAALPRPFPPGPCLSFFLRCFHVPVAGGETCPSLFWRDLLAHTQPVSALPGEASSAPLEGVAKTWWRSRGVGCRVRASPAFDAAQSGFVACVHDAWTSSQGVSGLGSGPVTSGSSEGVGSGLAALLVLGLHVPWRDCGPFSQTWVVHPGHSVCLSGLGGPSGTWLTQERVSLLLGIPVAPTAPSVPSRELLH